MQMPWTNGEKKERRLINRRRTLRSRPECAWLPDTCAKNGKRRARTILFPKQYNGPTAQHAKKIAPSAQTFDLVMRVSKKNRSCGFVLERLQRQSSFQLAAQ